MAVPGYQFYLKDIILCLTLIGELIYYDYLISILFGSMGLNGGIRAEAKELSTLQFVYRPPIQIWLPAVFIMFLADMVTKALFYPACISS